jgi:DNA end-binding protein Ku
MGHWTMLLHYPYEVRNPEDYFGDIPDEKAPKEMIGLAVHIIDTMAGAFRSKKVRRPLRGRTCGLIKREAAGASKRRSDVMKS